jgi:hypothetical protein
MTSATHTPTGGGGWQVFTATLYGGIDEIGGQVTGAKFIYDNISI